MSIPNESTYILWVQAANRWSPRAQSDLLSRLRRADAIEPLQNAKSFNDYKAVLTSRFEWTNIPPTSQSSVLQAARIYLDWKSTLSK